MEHEIIVPPPAPPRKALLTVNLSELGLLKYAMEMTYGGLPGAGAAHKLIDDLNLADRDFRL